MRIARIVGLALTACGLVNSVVFAVTPMLSDQELADAISAQPSSAWESVRIISADGSRTGLNVVCYAAARNFVCAMGVLSTNGHLAAYQVETDGVSPLAFAVASDATQCVELLVSSRPDWANLPTGAGGEPLLFDAVHKGSAALVQLLLPDVTNINHESSAGMTVLDSVPNENWSIFCLLRGAGAVYGGGRPDDYIGWERQFIVDEHQGKALVCHSNRLEVELGAVFTLDWLTDHSNSVDGIVGGVSSNSLSRSSLIRVATDDATRIVTDFVRPSLVRLGVIGVFDVVQTNGVFRPHDIIPVREMW